MIIFNAISCGVAILTLAYVLEGKFISKKSKIKFAIGFVGLIILNILMMVLGENNG